MDPWCELDTAISLDQFTCENDTTPVSEESNGRRKWEKTYELPACRVCGRKGSGLHYGVNTCEACKVFFRRSLSRRNTYRCLGSGSCNITAHMRTTCSSCRFRKCLDIGMSLEGIRYGRTSLKKIREDVEEVKHTKLITQTDITKTRERDAVATRDKTYRDDVTVLLNVIMPAYTDCASQWDQIDSEVLQLNCQLLTKLNISDSIPVDFSSIVCAGCDRTCLGRFLQNREQTIRGLVKFAKCIPEYRALPLNDQISLFKNSLPDLAVVNRHRRVDPFSRAYKLHTVEQEDELGLRVDQMFGPEFGGAFVASSLRLRRLNLTEEEVALLSGMVLFNPDESFLEEQDKIVKIHADFVDALQWLLTQNHENSNLVFAQIVGAITEMRSLVDQRNRFFKQLMESNMHHLTIPQLFKEVMSLQAFQ